LVDSKKLIHTFTAVLTAKKNAMIQKKNDAKKILKQKNIEYGINIIYCIHPSLRTHYILLKKNGHLISYKKNAIISKKKQSAIIQLIV